ncbi:Aldo/keto reductase, partial [Cadophora sp. DSE1049]
IIYSTAWKKERPSESTFSAIERGYRAFDTACQPRSYREDLVGKGIRRAIAEGILKARDEIWVQSKFTPPSGHDVGTAPFDLSASISEQVHTSIARSLQNLSYKKAWIFMQMTTSTWTLVTHKIRTIGVSNMPLSILRRLYAAVDVKPGVVQNRFIAETRYEIPLRRFCRVRGISFQAFSVLKDESDVLNSTLVENAAACLGKGTSKGLAMHLMALSLG